MNCYDLTTTLCSPSLCATGEQVEELGAKLSWGTNWQKIKLVFLKSSLFHLWQ